MAEIPKSYFDNAIKNIGSNCVPCCSGEHQYKIDCEECYNYPYHLATTYLQIEREQIYGKE